MGGNGKRNKGECHACENSVNTDRFNPRAAGEEKLVTVVKMGFRGIGEAEREAIRHEGSAMVRRGGAGE